MRVIFAVGAGIAAQAGFTFGVIYGHIWVVPICIYVFVVLSLYSIHEALKDFRA